jgi:hypothetical protein
MRTDYGKVLILGQSGYGKSFTAKTANLETTGYINVERKPLPFQGKFKWTGKPKNWMSFIANLKDYGSNPEITHIFIDSQSMAFDELYKEMQKNFKGFDIYGNYNRMVVEYFDLLRDIEKDIIVTGHDEILLVEGYRQRRAKIHGKTYEGRVEAYFTTVLYADKRLKENKTEFFLATDAIDTSCKVPENLFGGNREVPNSASYIFDELGKYYSVPDQPIPEGVFEP